MQPKRFFLAKNRLFKAVGSDRTCKIQLNLLFGFSTLQLIKCVLMVQIDVINSIVFIMLLHYVNQ